MPICLQDLRAIALRAGVLSTALQLEHPEIEPGFVALGRHLSGVQEAARKLLADNPEAPGTGAPAELAPVISGVRALLERTETIAYDLQFGDILRQKLEHIIAALRDIAHWLSAASPRLDSHLRATEADCLLALQAAQLDALSKDAKTIVGHISEYFVFVETTGKALGRSSAGIDPDLCGIACEARHELGHIEEFANAVARQLEPLESLRDALQPWLVTGLDVSTLLSHYASHYTVGVEWHSHHRTTGAANAACATADRVEFF